MTRNCYLDRIRKSQAVNISWNDATIANYKLLSNVRIMYVSWKFNISYSFCEALSKLVDGFKIDFIGFNSVFCSFPSSAMVALRKYRTTKYEYRVAQIPNYLNVGTASLLTCSYLESYLERVWGREPSGSYIAPNQWLWQ